MHKLIGLILIVAAAAFVSPSGFAQQSAKVARIGFLGPTSAPPPAASQLDVFRKALADVGYVEGRNIIIEGRWPEGERLDQLPAIAAALVSLKPDVIVAAGATAVRAAGAATTEIPVVFAAVVDPVATGLVANLARPGGNLTGATTFDPGQARQQLVFLKDTIPDLARVALLGDTGAAPALFQTNDEAAQSLGLQTQILKVERGAANPDFDGAFEAAKKASAGAVVVLSTPVTTPNRRRIAEAAIKYRMPTLSPGGHADAEGLISFGTEFSEVTRRAAAFVDKILKGASPGDLPIETVKDHEIIINLKTAREIGLTFPPAVVSRATRVVQ
jgi:putative ABC transport system substrate-binding protein